MRHHHSARFPALWYTTTEETRLMKENRLLFEPEVNFLSWDLVNGFQSMHKVAENGYTFQPSETKILDPVKAMEAIGSLPQESVIFMKDFHRYFDGPSGIKPIRQFLNMKDMLKAQGKMIVFVSAVQRIPDELRHDVQIMDFGYPDEAGLRRIAEKVAEDNEIEVPNMDSVVNALRGLTSEAAENVLALSVTQFDSFDVNLIIEQKAAQLKASEVLSFEQYKETMEDLYGFDIAKAFLRKTILNPDSLGSLFYGTPGCGKSHIIKAAGREFGIPTIAMNFSALRGKYQGDAESRLRDSFRTIRAFGTVFVICDELDKAVAGSGASDVDGGVGARIYGELLKEMEDRKGSGVKWFATANSLHEILHYSGGAMQRRFDQFWFVDMPTSEECKGIAKIWGNKKGVEVPEDFDFTNYTGADIAKLCSVMKMLKCDAWEASEYVIPYGRANASELENIRKQAEGVCKWVSKKADTTIRAVRKVRKGGM
jgi:hypothetical protein